MSDLIYRLRKRAEIRRGIKTRKSVQNNEPDRISDLLEEAALELEKLVRAKNKMIDFETECHYLNDILSDQFKRIEDLEKVIYILLPYLQCYVTSHRAGSSNKDLEEVKKILTESKIPLYKV